MSAPPSDLPSLLRDAVARRGRPFERVVHLGAGPEASDAQVVGVSRQLVLVEGEAEIAAELRARLEVADGPVRIVQAIVTPAGGPALWRRYNPRMLSGPRDASAWRAWFPRLQELAVLPVQTIAIDELLAEWGSPGPTDDARAAAGCLLVVDLPGQETDLLANLPAPSLRRFGVVVVHRGPERPVEDPLVRRMAEAGFDLDEGAVATASAFGWECYRFDAPRDEQRRLAAAETEARQRAVEATDLRRRLEVAEARLAAEDATALKAERDALASALAEGRATAKLMSERVGQLEAELAGAHSRARLMQQELLKAEGQLDALKDLLLGDQAL